MRIDIIMLISGLSREELENRRRSLLSYASLGTEIRLIQTRNAPKSVESQAEMELAAAGILEQVVRSTVEGADALVIWGGHDPSLKAARELTSIPVLGPGMASMYLASMLAERFSLLVQLPNVVDLARSQVRGLGLQGKCVGVYPVGIPVLKLGKPESFNLIRDTAVRSIEDGADAVCFGCMAMNNHAEKLAQSLSESHPGAIVIPPGKAAIRLAELIVGLGISHSKRSYPNPPKEVEFAS
ncbi:MAG: aspartate/glutamate racemase family protein [Candidatus Bathyarchaeia archaeon]